MVGMIQVTVMSDNCPKCNAPVSASAEECPSCGILFSKWELRQTNVAEGNMARYAIANATSSEFNWTILIIVATVIASIFYFLERNQ
jgi:ribosomal protein L40E